MDFEIKDDHNKIETDETNLQEAKVKKDDENIKEYRNVEDAPENKSVNEDILDEKLSFLEDRIYLVENSIETSYKKTVLFNTEINEKLSRFENSEQS